PQGNYFESVLQNTGRWQGRADVTLLGRQWHGAHDIQAGINGDGTNMDQTAIRSPIEIRQQSGALVRSTSFVGTPFVSTSQIRTGAYVQDAWKVASTVIIQSSLRVDGNNFIGKVLPQPRLVVNWIPQNSDKFSFGCGFYNQPIYLSL